MDNADLLYLTRSLRDAVDRDSPELVERYLTELELCAADEGRRLFESERAKEHG